jgi:hypothetical protein
MTAAEIGERDLKAGERQNKKQRPTTPMGVPEEAEEEIQVPGIPEQQCLPPSTAPARLTGDDGEGGEGRGKRKRKMTEAYRQARQAGLSSLGYSQVEE